MDKSFGAVTFLPCILLSTAAVEADANADDDTAGFIFFTRDGAGHMHTSTQGGTFEGCSSRKNEDRSITAISHWRVLSATKNVSASADLRCIQCQ